MEYDNGTRTPETRYPVLTGSQRITTVFQREKAHTAPGRVHSPRATVDGQSLPFVGPGAAD